MLVNALLSFFECHPLDIHSTVAETQGNIPAGLNLEDTVDLTDFHSAAYADVEEVSRPDTVNFAGFLRSGHLFLRLKLGLALSLRSFRLRLVSFWRRLLLGPGLIHTIPISKHARRTSGGKQHRHQQHSRGNLEFAQEHISQHSFRQSNDGGGDRSQ